MIESGLYSFLSGNTNFSAVAGNRIYPVILPQNATFPCITYRIEGDERGFNFSDGQEGFVGASIQIDAWGESYKSAKALAEILRSELMNYSGLMGSVSVNRVFVDTPIDIYEDRVERFRSSRLFLIWYKEG